MSGKRVLEIATSQIGVKEHPPGSNSCVFNSWFYGHDVHDGDKPGAKYPWCLVFCSWCYDQAGVNLGVVDYKKGAAGTNYAISHLIKWGRLVTVPAPGDIVIYDWNGDGRFEHAGIFEKDLGQGLFSAIEGNTSFENDSNGGQVMRRADRKYKNAVFVRPHVIDVLI
jgi:hypothetical protein